MSSKRKAISICVLTRFIYVQSFKLSQNGCQEIERDKRYRKDEKTGYIMNYT
ncbi:MAG: hypothetical protein SCALA701_06900 [Candidatus Scalindua sp.]|nr:MAG: hypothetical protein SCALA701_06900 [Candidatus Scalindua sp.]